MATLTPKPVVGSESADDKRADRGIRSGIRKFDVNKIILYDKVIKPLFGQSKIQCC
jgi:hypothetical protein